MLRFLLAVLAIYFVIRIIRGIISFFFPPMDAEKRQTVESSRQNKPEEYSDVQDAKFKDLENPQE